VKLKRKNKNSKNVEDTLRKINEICAKVDALNEELAKLRSDLQDTNSTIVMKVDELKKRGIRELSFEEKYG
jgi:peptidoglycan hydrolase CwlO-like protein